MRKLLFAISHFVTLVSGHYSRFVNKSFAARPSSNHNLTNKGTAITNSNISTWVSFLTPIRIHLQNRCQTVEFAQITSHWIWKFRRNFNVKKLLIGFSNTLVRGIFWNKTMIHFKSFSTTLLLGDFWRPFCCFVPTGLFMLFLNKFLWNFFTQDADLYL